MDDLDVAVIGLHESVAHSPIASPGRIGERVCKTGRMTGLSCGPIIAVTDTSIVAKVRVLPGDSGGPLRDSAGRTIGMTSRLNADPHRTSPIKAWTEAVTGPVATRFVRADKITDRIRLR